MGKHKRLNKHTIVAVTFLDHVEAPEPSKAERYTVYGRVISDRGDAMVIGTWCHSDKRRAYNNNTTTYTILRNVITRVQVLTPTDL